MSIVGIRSSSPAPRISRLPADSEPPTSYSRPRETTPPSISDAFAVVPPMSNEIAFAMPSRCATPSAATTPAAGPDSSASTGRCPVSSAVITPPDDCMIVSGASIPARSSPLRIPATYSRISGRTYALTTVVAERSYSRCSRRISLDSETATPGSSARRISPSCSSWSAKRYECSRQTATDSTPSAASRAATSRASSGSSARSTVPSAVTRSFTSYRRRRGTSGSGLRQNGSYMCGMRSRRSSSTSRNPAVVTSAVSAPRRSSTAFVATVVPCTTAATSVPSAASPLTPETTAAS